MILRKLFILFISAFILNFIWENTHSLLYSNYMGSVITEYILLKASFWDAVIIAIIGFLFLWFPSLRKRNWLIIPIGIIVAFIIEWYALGTGRWSYNTYMPIVPILKIGLTPILQLGILGFASLWFLNTLCARVYRCPECGLHYEDKNQAKKCETWCTEHKSCNLEITSEAIKNKK